MLATATAHMESTTTIWQDRPASSWLEAFPIGDGRVGAMVFGGVDEERIGLNESSVWSGGPSEDNRPEAHRELPMIRRLLIAGRNAEASARMTESFTCLGAGSGLGEGANVPFGCYQTLGNLRLMFQGGSPSAVGDAQGYCRSLDLRTAAATVSYRRNGIHYQRTHFVSAPDRLFVSRFQADKPGSVSFSATLDRPERFVTQAVSSDELLMVSTLSNGRGGNGVTLAARLRVILVGGVIRANGNRLEVNGADEALLLLAAATDYRGFGGRQLTDPLGATAMDLEAVREKSFAELRTAQQLDHGRWFSRTELDLPATANSVLPASERLAGFAAGDEDPAARAS